MKCLCGCNLEAKKGKRYLSGHSLRLKENRDKGLLVIQEQFKNGRKVWNKDLTKKTDARVEKYASKTRGRKKEDYEYLQKASELLSKLNHTEKRKRERSEEQTQLWKNSKYREETLVKVGFVKGRKVWNDGLTEETDTRVAKYSEKRLKTMKENDSFCKGENHWNWQGGNTEDSYPLEFNKELKYLIRKKYNFVCALCSLHKSLSVHHLDWDKSNTHVMNLIPLCINCHAHMHQSKHWRDNINYRKYITKTCELYDNDKMLACMRGE